MFRNCDQYKDDKVKVSTVSTRVTPESEQYLSRVCMHITTTWLLIVKSQRQLLTPQFESKNH